jgi:hypothetical protein
VAEDAVTREPVSALNSLLTGKFTGNSRNRGLRRLNTLRVGVENSSRMVKIGHLESGLPSSSPNLLAAFRQGLRELGYVEGQNVVIVSRYGEGRKSVFLSLPRSLSQYGVPIDCGEFPREWLLFHVTVLLPSGRGTSQTRALSDAPDTYIKVTLRRIVGFRFAIICEWGACWVGGMTHTACWP